MATEVKSKSDLTTRDLLGGCSNDLDLDLLSPSTKKTTPAPTTTLLDKYPSPASNNDQHRPLQDLNLLPEDSSALDLKLFSSSSSTTTSNFYQSVCTLDKVKLALERVAAKDSESSRKRPRTSSYGSASSTSPCSSSSTVVIEEGSESTAAAGGTGMVAGGCPSCLLYVLISRQNPRCPGCDSHVPFPKLYHNNINSNSKKARVVDFTSSSITIEKQKQYKSKQK